jgi:glucokinase
MAKSDRVSLGLDVGGTNVRAGVVSGHAKLIGKLQSGVSPSQETADKVVSTFVDLASRAINTAKNEGYVVNTCGVGIPGPFDYDTGISHMEHKFQSIYRQNLKVRLEQALGIPTSFLNDASAFGLGVSWVEYPNKKRILALTVGTGLGSSFIVDGHLGNQVDSITQNGEIWNFPYKEGILEDYISKGAISGHYKKITGSQEEVELIAKRAREKDTAAVESFSIFAKDLGEGLASSVSSFHPNIVVLGGKIGVYAFDLFGKKAERTFAKVSGYKVTFVPAANEFLAIYGAAYHALYPPTSRVE